MNRDSRNEKRNALEKYCQKTMTKQGFAVAALVPNTLVALGMSALTLSSCICLQTSIGIQGLFAAMPDRSIYSAFRPRRQKQRHFSLVWNTSKTTKYPGKTTKF